MRGYAVFDLETTGFRTPVDRIVEVGVVALRPDGSVEGEWETLVNPGRDVGATWVHGISASDVLGAPAFGDIADELEDVLEGRALVAHNASFDLRFLSTEMAGAGRLRAGDLPPSVCTMRNARHFLDTPTTKLADCCAAAGVDLRNAHSALGDARATAELFGYYLTRAGRSLPWADVLRQVDAFRGWAPHQVGSGSRQGAAGGGGCTRWTRADGARSRELGADWVARAVGARDMSGGSEVEDYFLLLDRALLDHHLSQSEQKELLGFAEGRGLSALGLRDLHLRYLADLARSVWEDGVVEEAEAEEFSAVAALLGVPPNTGAEVLRSAGVPASAGVPGTSGVPGTPGGRAAGASTGASAGASPAPDGGGGSGRRHGFSLAAGDRIVVTSPRLLSREEWERRILEAGLEPGGMRKSARVLVAGDPDSLSGKARKAREYGIPIVTEEAMLHLLAGRAQGARGAQRPVRD